MCPSLMQNGVCENSQCQFAHSWQELRATNSYQKVTMCRFYALGTCYAGKHCRHAHSLSELRWAPEDGAILDTLNEANGLGNLAAKLNLTDRGSVNRNILEDGAMLEAFRDAIGLGSEWMQSKSSSSVTRQRLPVGPLGVRDQVQYADSGSGGLGQRFPGGPAKADGGQHRFVGRQHLAEAPLDSHQLQARSSQEAFDRPRYQQVNPRQAHMQSPECFDPSSNETSTAQHMQQFHGVQKRVPVDPMMGVMGRESGSMPLSQRLHPQA